MRFGKYHPYSRTTQDYIHNYSLKKPIYDDDKIKIDSGLGPTTPPHGAAGNPTFDLRQLANPGYFRYWGRRHYYDAKVDETKKINPFPFMSLAGTSLFIAKLIEVRTRDMEKIKEYLRIFPSINVGEKIEDPNELIIPLEEFVALQQSKKEHPQ